jgi:large subunit ribosomal protein L10
LAISKARKDELLAQYGELIADSRAIFLTEYKGMSVKNISDLRDKVYEAEGTFHITKNTLLQRALQEANVEIPTDLFIGQLATGFALGEAPTLAKTLVDFAKGEEHIIIRGGFLGDKYLSAEEVETLAKLPSLEQLRAQLAGLISTPGRNIASTISSGIRQVVNVMDAYAKKEEGAAEAA